MWSQHIQPADEHWQCSLKPDLLRTSFIRDHSVLGLRSYIGIPQYYILHLHLQLIYSSVAPLGPTPFLFFFFQGWERDNNFRRKKRGGREGRGGGGGMGSRLFTKTCTYNTTTCKGGKPNCVLFIVRGYQKLLQSHIV